MRRHSQWRIFGILAVCMLFAACTDGIFFDAIAGSGDEETGETEETDTSDLPGQWQRIGNYDFEGDDHVTLRMTVDNSGYPFFAYLDEDQDSQTVYAYQYTGSEFTSIPFEADETEFGPVGTFSVAAGTAPYLAVKDDYADGDNEQNTAFYRHDGEGWSQKNNQTAEYGFSTLAAAAGGGISAFVVHRHDGINELKYWKEGHTQDASFPDESEHAGLFTLAVFDGALYLARQGNGALEVHCWDDNTDDWDSVMFDWDEAGEVSDLSLHSDGSSLYVSYVNGSEDRHVLLDDGTEIFGTIRGSSTYNAFAAGGGRVAAAAAYDEDDEHSLKISVYEDGSWGLLPELPGGPGSDLSGRFALAVNDDGEIFVVYYQEGEFIVSRYRD